MKIVSSDNSRERFYLTAMICDPLVLAKVSRSWDGDKFVSKDANTIGTWCVTYFEKYRKAPFKRIKQIFERWSQGRNPEQVTAMDRLLQSLGDDYAQYEGNSGFSLDQISEYFTKVALTKLQESLQSLIESGRVTEADTLVSQYRRVEFGSHATIDPLRDDAAIEAVFDKKLVKPVVAYPGALGHFFREPLRRGNFVVFAAAQKVGKTRFLIDLAYRAVVQRKRTLFVTLGDQSEEQMDGRLFVRVCSHPLLSSNRDGSWPCEIAIPTSIVGPAPGDDFASVTTGNQMFDGPLDVKKTKQEVSDFIQTQIRSSKSFYQRRVTHAKGLSIPGIEAIIGDLTTEGWVPDVVIVDYLDNLAPVNAKQELRHQISMNWELARSMALKYHCLVVGATQIRTGGHKARVILREHLGRESNAVLDSVTGIVAINQTIEEKRMGLYRLNWPVLRDCALFDERTVVHVAGCAALEDPAMHAMY